MIASAPIEADDIGSEALAAKLLRVADEQRRRRHLPHEPSLDAPIGEEGLGFDSIGRLDLLAAIEKECGVSIPEQYWGARQPGTLGELLRIAVRS